MDTQEHTELGNALRFIGWDELKGNPYISFDEQGTMHLNLQGIAENGLPQHIDLILSAGEVVGMSGDYFGGGETDLKLDLPSKHDFTHNRQSYETDYSCENLGEYLINEPITESEMQKLIESYLKLANPSVQKSEIDTIYAINGANYIPFSSTLNGYVQQLMFALRVKNYGEILNRNLSHFTPWSVRVYILGHSIALKYARMSYELKRLIEDEHYTSNNEEFNTLIATLKQSNELSKDKLQDLVYRYQALALGMELFCFHYYSDHYAAGHGALVGDLREELPARFGLLGGILVNSVHDELNRVTVYTKKPYDPTPDITDPPVEAGGDGDFNSAKNYYNRLACIAGMQESMQDLHNVFLGHDIPKQAKYGGLEKLPDIDVNYRQPQPLFLLGDDNKIYYRTNLSKIRILAPSEFQETYRSPTRHGYTELTNSFMAFILVIMLRVFSYFYEGQLQPLTEGELRRIEFEEALLNPGRKPIPQPPVVETGVQPVPEAEPVSLLHWQEPASKETMFKGLNRNGFLAPKSPPNTPVSALSEEEQEEKTFTSASAAAA
ncbi:hypothetical protein [Legionella fallonii]|uniref:Substrate of the Dot/Icm secretion sytem n=1 Tax=Legionella fallonii LLAP-10 TaxID=1212491 RepID=A0A098G204_9GAMM|nr:hypothetical protein [Legionella fallonii]CEG56508.1 substrate of the Dot/Icm secretion sytem [Legionella fallonii LLAP-10]